MNLSLSLIRQFFNLSFILSVSNIIAESYPVKITFEPASNKSRPKRDTEIADNNNCNSNSKLIGCALTCHQNYKLNLSIYSKKSFDVEFCIKECLQVIICSIKICYEKKVFCFNFFLILLKVYDLL